MKNTGALLLVIVGAIVMYAGYKDWTLRETVRYFAGQKPPPPKPGAGDGGTGLLGPGPGGAGGEAQAAPRLVPLPVPQLPGALPGAPNFAPIPMTP